MFTTETSSTQKGHRFHDDERISEKGLLVYALFLLLLFFFPFTHGFSIYLFVSNYYSLSTRNIV